MFYNYEEKRKRQMMGLEPNDWSNNTNPNPLPSAKPMEEMTTREALETAWNNSLASNRQNSLGQSSESSYMSGQEDMGYNSNQPAFNPATTAPAYKPRYAELNFDGQKLDWVENDQTTKPWQAMSGRPEYQNRADTGIKNLGPPSRRTVESPSGEFTKL